MAILYLDRRTAEVRVPRASLSAAAEDALAASRMAQEAVDRARQHVWSGYRAGAIHELGRIGFELEQRADALRNLTRLAEQAPAICPDHKAKPGHGAAA